VLRIFICKSDDEMVIENLVRRSLMEEKLKDKINWFAFGRKLWFKGIRSALKEEITEVTTNSFDDLGLSLIDSVIDRLLPDSE